MANEQRHVGRRGFFAALGGTIVAAPVVTVHAGDKVLTFGQPICPHCGNVQWIPCSGEFPDVTSWRLHVTTPQTITCINERYCGKTLTVTFAREG